MKTDMNPTVNKKSYFEEIGVWPEGSHIARAYIVGFILSLLLTIAAYVLAVNHLLTMRVGIVTLLILACIQFAVQIICFLHLDFDARKASSRDRLILLGCAAIVVLIVVSGSIWIMFSLNLRMMPSTAQMEQYMNDQAGI